MIARVATLLTLLLPAAVIHAQSVEFIPPREWHEPPVVEPGPDYRTPPSDAIILFDGTDLSAWENADNWKIADGVVYCGEGDITTKQEFGDCQFHVEWVSPIPATGKGQARGNSGIFMMDKYEVQVLDSYKNPTYHDGQAAAIYKQTPPMANATRPPGHWNYYDIFWTSPQFESGELKSPAKVSVMHNGVLVVNHFELEGSTAWHRPPRYETDDGKGPVRLQWHKNPVGFRNIWIRELKPPTYTPRPAKYINHRTGKEWPAEDDEDSS